ADDAEKRSAKSGHTLLIIRRLTEHDAPLERRFDVSVAQTFLSGPLLAQTGMSVPPIQMMHWLRSRLLGCHQCARQLSHRRLVTSMCQFNPPCIVPQREFTKPRYASMKARHLSRGN